MVSDLCRPHDGRHGVPENAIDERRQRVMDDIAVARDRLCVLQHGDRECLVLDPDGQRPEREVEGADAVGRADQPRQTAH